MKVGVYFPKDDELHTAALASMAAGISKYGDHVIPAYLDDFDGELQDVGVVFGMKKKMVPRSFARGKVFDAYRAAGKNVLVLEKGYVRRDEYFAVGWNALNGRADFGIRGVEFGRVDVGGDRWRDLGVELKPYRESAPTDYVLVAGQVPWDASVQDVDHLAWLTSTVERLLGYTDREIAVRPHPLAVSYTPHFLGASRSENGLEDALSKAHAVVTFNSNLGVDALIAGVPVFAADEGSMVYDLAEHDLAHIGNPEKPDREVWANRIAYAQWNVQELAEGLAWEHVREFPL